MLAKSKRLDRRATAALWYAGAQVAFVVFAFLPAVVYFFNTAFVEYPLMDHYVFAFPIAALISVIPLAVAVIPRAPQRLILSVCRSVVTYIVIASIFFPSSTPALDGEEQFADILSRVSIQSHLVLGILAVAIIIALARWPDQTKILSHAMFAAAIVFVAYTVILDSKQEHPDASDLVKQDIERLVTYSSQRNTLIVLMDTFQGDVFAEILAEDKDLAQQFDGFVYYPNITSASPYTLAAIPAIYSGRLYGGGPLREFYREVYRDSIFSDARQAGYASSLYGYYFFGCPADTCVKLPVLLKGLVRTILASYLGLIDYGLMRVSPVSLHPHIYQDGLGSLKQLASTHKTIDSLHGLERFIDRSRVDDVPPTFKFVHMMNTHSPINMNEECRLDPDRERTRLNYRIQARCGIDVFLRLLASLKRSSIYDGSLLVLLSDHGASIPVPSQSHVHVLDHNVRLHGGHTGRFLPLLLVKPPGSTAPLKISQAPASLIDLRATICEATKTCRPPPDGVSVLSLSEHASRKRTFIAYRNSRGVAERNGLRPEDIQTFSLSGSVEDLDKVTDSAGGHLR